MFRLLWGDIIYISSGFLGVLGWCVFMVVWVGLGFAGGRGGFAVSGLFRFGF